MDRYTGHPEEPPLMSAEERNITREHIRRKRRELARRRRRRFFGCLFLLFASVAFLSFLLFAGYTLVSWGSHLYQEYQSVRQGYEQRQEARRGPVDPRFDGYTNLLVLGVDEGADDSSSGNTHADTVLVISTENETGKVRFITIPRDTLVPFPDGNGEGRIEDVYAVAGAPSMVRTVNKLLDISIHQYIVLHTKAFADLIDALGGVDAYVEGDMNYDDHKAGLSIHLKQGYQHLTGEQAQGYLRYRSPELGEMGRVQRQQKFVKSLYEELLQVDTIPRLPAIAEIFKNEIETSAEIFDSAHLANVLCSLSSEQPVTVMLPGDMAEDGTWIPDRGRIEEKMKELFTPTTINDNKEEKSKE